MRIQTQFLKCIPITALLFTGLVAGGIAQDTTTTINSDNESPTITTTNPSDGEVNVDLNGAIEITFSTEMDESTINDSNIKLYATSAELMHNEQDRSQNHHTDERAENRDFDNGQQQYNGDAIKGTIRYSDKVAVFTPDTELNEGTTYSFTITNDVKSAENVALENEYNWSFSTMDSADLARADQQDDSDRYGRDSKEYSESLNDTTRNDENGKIELGKAGQYVILAKSGVNNGSESRITGETGEGSVSEKNKEEKAFADSVRQTTSDEVLVLQSDESDTTSSDAGAGSDQDVDEAIEDMLTAYNSASSQNGTEDSSQRNANFNDSELTAGIYEWSDSLHIDSDVTLSGDADDVWIFKVANNLNVHEDSEFTLSGGALAENIFWIVEGEVNIGKNAQFEGIILSMSDIKLEKGAQLSGRLFSQASISLDDNTVTEPATMSTRTTSTNLEE